jgi:hypothetical protein
MGLSGVKGILRQADRSLILFFQNKESRLKMGKL